MTATLQTVLCLWLAPILLGFLQLCQAISTCEQQALEHVQAHPDAGRVLRRGIDIPELPDLETKYGEGRWTKCVYKHKDSCAQVCASVQYFWEKKSSKVADATFLSDFPAPTPCSQGAPSSGPKKPSSKGTGTDGGPKKPWRKDLRGGPKESDDYYKALGLQKGATDKEIKKAFKKQAMKWHPDKHQDPQDKAIADDKFHLVSEAYQVLSDPEKKALYDECGKACLDGEQGGRDEPPPKTGGGRTAGGKRQGSGFGNGGLNFGSAPGGFGFGGAPNFRANAAGSSPFGKGGKKFRR